MFEEANERLAEVVGPPVARIAQAIFRAATVALFQPSTGLTFRRQLGLDSAEFILLLGIEHLDEALLLDITKPPFPFHKEVARKDVPVVFNDHVVPTLLKERTLRRAHIHIGIEKGVKKADGNGGSAVFEILLPAVEDIAEELAIVIGGNRKLGCAFGIFRVCLHAGDELHVVDPEGLVVFVDLPSEFGGIVADNTQSVEFNPFSSHPLRRFADLVVGRFPVASNAVVVVNVRGTIDGKSDQPIGLAEKIAPLVIDQQTIRLKPITNHLAVATVLFLQADGTLEELETHHRRFPALPSKRDLPAPIAHHLFDHGFLDIIAHPASMKPVESPAILLETGTQYSGPVKIEAVSTVDVAVGARRLDEDGGEGLEGSRRVH